MTGFTFFHGPPRMWTMSYITAIFLAFGGLGFMNTAMAAQDDGYFITGDTGTTTVPIVSLTKQAVSAPALYSMIDDTGTALKTASTTWPYIIAPATLKAAASTRTSELTPKMAKHQRGFDRILARVANTTAQDSKKGTLINEAKTDLLGTTSPMTIAAAQVMKADGDAGSAGDFTATVLTL